MTKARVLTTAGLIHLTVAALLSLTFLFGQPSTAVGSGMGFTPTPAESINPTRPKPTPEPVCDPRCNKTASPSEVLPGDLVTLVIEACNEGDKACDAQPDIQMQKGVVVSDDLPDELEVVSASASQGRAVVVGDDVRAEFGDLLPGVCAELTIVARLRDDVDLCTQFENVSTIGDLISNRVTLIVPCLPESGESAARGGETSAQSGAIATQVVVVGLLAVGIGLLAAGLALRARSRAR
jgi:uncharacterized repeat protein (TIGR01451 family)